MSVGESLCVVLCHHTQPEGITEPFMLFQGETCLILFPFPAAVYLIMLSRSLLRIKTEHNQID